MDPAQQRTRGRRAARRGGHPAGSTRGRGDGPYAAGAPRGGGGPASAFPRRAAREVPSQTLGSWKRPKTRTATTESLGDSPFRPPERVLLGGGRPSGSGRVGGRVRPPLGVPASPGGAGAGAAEPPALPAPARAGQGAPWLPAAGAWRFRGFTPAASCPDVGLGSRRPRWPPRCPATAAHTPRPRPPRRLPASSSPATPPLPLRVGGPSVQGHASCRTRPLLAGRLALARTHASAPARDTQVRKLGLTETAQHRPTEQPARQGAGGPWGARPGADGAITPTPYRDT